MWQSELRAQLNPVTCGGAWRGLPSVTFGTSLASPSASPTPWLWDSQPLTMHLPSCRKVFPKSVGVITPDTERHGSVYVPPQLLACVAASPREAPLPFPDVPYLRSTCCPIVCPNNHPCALHASETEQGAFGEFWAVRERSAMTCP